MYQLNLLESPKKFLKKIKDKNLLLKLVKAIEGLKYNPLPINHKKLSGGLGYRIRIGDYRVLYTVDKTVQIVEIYKIGHRREIYR